MATLDDVVTVQKNGVVALSRIGQALVPNYPFNAYNGGQGVSITASTASSSVALAGASDSAPYAFVCNQSGTWASIQFGDSSVTATISSMSVPPNACSLVTVGILGKPFPTHMAAITASGTAFLQVTMGYGGT